VAWLRKSLYGLKQAPRNWFNTFTTWLKKYGFVAHVTDPCLMVFYDEDNLLRCVINVYVDDVPGAICADRAWYEVFIKAVEEEYKIKETPLHWCLGMAIHQEPGLVTASHSQYVLDTLDRFGFSGDDIKPELTPLPGNAVFHKRDCPARPSPARCTLYRQMIGSLNWLATSTRVDLALAVSLAAQVMQNPSERHLEWVTHIFRYLKGTPDVCLRYVGNSHASDKVEGHCDGVLREDQVKMAMEFGVLEGYADADYAACLETRRSHSGFVMMLNGGPVSWMSKKQDCVTHSTTEAELVALDYAAREAVYLRSLMRTVAVPQHEPTPLHEDNEGCVHLAANEASLNRTRHVGVRYFYVRDEQELGTVDVVPVSTNDQLADILTKPLGPEKFIHFRRLIMGS
jgi:hypothetical protein